MSQETFKLMITKPCSKNWDAMLQTNDGRHCNSCKKSVIDFSEMKDDEVKNYFLRHKDEEICGRFYSNQLDRIKIYLPNNIFQSDIAQWKKYIIILMICFGANLFSVEVVLGQTIDSLPAKDSIRPINSLEIADSLKAIDTSLVNCTMLEKDTLDVLPDFTGCVITGTAIQTINIVYGGIGMVPAKLPDLTIIEVSTMGMIGTNPQIPTKTFAEILNEQSVSNEIKIPALSNSSSNPANKKPPQKQEPPQQQEFVIPDEIKIKRRK